ncbi:MAG: molybdopterin cofactor-binding domain-containing protein [Jiangellaceae bacterium]
MTGAPKGLVANPRLSTWVAVDSEGVVHLTVGKVELGQGILTALTQLAADELDGAPAQVRVLAATTAGGPDEGPTAGSMSVADSGTAVRVVCAHVQSLFLVAAADRLGVDTDDLDIQEGCIRSGDGTRATSYAELAHVIDLDRDVDVAIRRKTTDELRLTGTSMPRIDLPDKVVGGPRFIQDLVLPDQLWGRVVRPPSPAAVLADVDLDAARELPGVIALVHEGSFLGIVADDELAAERAAEILRAAATWHEEPTLPDEHDLASYLRGGAVTTFAVDETGDLEGAAPVVRRFAATYNRPFLAHASMSPSCGVARWDGDSVHVWSHSQSIFGLRGAVALALGMDTTRVSVEHVQGAGAYGPNGADDAAFDAVMLARAVPGRPVHVRWSRADELSWSPFGSPMSIELSVGVDARGRLVSWQADVWSQGHTSRPGYAGSPGLLAAAHRERRHSLPAPVDPPPERGGGSTRNAVPGYVVPVRRIRGHRLQEVALRSSSLRSLGAFMNVFAIESLVDEVAVAVGRDPLDFRLAHLDDERARAVLQTAADRAGWAERPRGDDVGYGLGYARYKATGAYCAAVAEVEAVHDVRVRRLTLAVDVGRVVNPDGVRNQIEGGAVQSTSWTLKERVRFDRTRVTSIDWETYPILRFSETPTVDVVLLDRTELPSVGSGEAAQGPTAAAIGNAVAAVLGVRVRDLPITAERVIEALHI